MAWKALRAGIHNYNGRVDKYIVNADRYIANADRYIASVDEYIEDAKKYLKKADKLIQDEREYCESTAQMHHDLLVEAEAQEIAERADLKALKTIIPFSSWHDASRSDGANNRFRFMASDVHPVSQEQIDIAVSDFISEELSFCD